MAEDIIKKLKKEMSELPDSWIAILETSAENTFKVSIEAMKILMKKGLTAIILSASRPHPNLFQLYKSNKIDTNKVFVLCCVVFRC